MTTEEAKAFVRRHFEAFVNHQDLSAADRNFAIDYQEHGADAPPNSTPGPEGPKQYLAVAFRRFPDIHVTIEDIIAEGDSSLREIRLWCATSGERRIERVSSRSNSAES
jgi:ketosteroid isomerase-like protein